MTQVCIPVKDGQITLGSDVTIVSIHARFPVYNNSFSTTFHSLNKDVVTYDVMNEYPNDMDNVMMYITIEDRPYKINGLRRYKDDISMIEMFFQQHELKCEDMSVEEKREFRVLLKRFKLCCHCKNQEELNHHAQTLLHEFKARLIPYHGKYAKDTILQDLGYDGKVWDAK